MKHTPVRLDFRLPVPQQFAHRAQHFVAPEFGNGRLRNVSAVPRPPRAGRNVEPPPRVQREIGEVQAREQTLPRRRLRRPALDRL